MPQELGEHHREPRLQPLKSNRPLIRCVVEPTSRRSTHDMVAAVIAKLLSFKSRMLLIAAIAASGLNALPAVAGPERLAHVTRRAIVGSALRWRLPFPPGT
jgi:hypothetical protein